MKKPNKPIPSGLDSDGLNEKQSSILALCLSISVVGFLTTLIVINIFN